MLIFNKINFSNRDLKITYSFIIAGLEYKWMGSWWHLLLLIFGLLMFISLGIWQLHRGNEKAVLLADWEASMADTEVQFSDYIQGPAKRYQMISIRGQYVPSINFLLDNQILDGRVGYEVLTPFKHHHNGTVLVDRGWLPAALDRRILPDLQTPDEEVTINARVKLQSDKSIPLLGAWISDSTWPKRIQTLDLERISKELDVNLTFHGLLLLQPGEAGGFQYRPLQIPRLAVYKHQAYALQWFVFAGLALLLFIIVPSKRVPPNAANASVLTPNNKGR